MDVGEQLMILGRGRWNFSEQSIICDMHDASMHPNEWVWASKDDQLTMAFPTGYES